MKINSNFNGENVDIISSNVSNDFVNITYITSAGDLKVSRKFIGIDDEVEIGTDAENVVNDSVGLTSSKEMKVLAVGNSIGDAAYGLKTSSGQHWALVAAGGAVSVNDIVHPSFRDLTKNYQIQAKCISAGNIGLIEPIWPELGQTITDGTATWMIEKTMNMNKNVGFFNLAQEFLGQPFNLNGIIGCPGRRSEYVIEITNSYFNQVNPDIVFVSDMFANDISQLAGDITLCSAAWNRVETFLDGFVSKGKFVILEGMAPGGMFNTPTLRNAAAFFDTKLFEWSEKNKNSCIFWSGLIEEESSLVYGENYNPDDVTTYYTHTGIFNKITDGVHPQNVAHWKLAKNLKNKLLKFTFPKYEFRDFGFTQRYDNPRNLGTTGSIGTGISGTAPTSWTVGRDGVAIARSTIIPRTDIKGNFWELSATSTNGGKIYAYRSISLAGLELSVGDEIEFYAEMKGENMSTSSFCPTVEISFYNATEYSAFASMVFTGGQTFGQAMNSDNLLQTIKPIPFKLKIPNGSTDIGFTISIEGAGNWYGKLVLGRININKV